MSDPEELADALGDVRDRVPLPFGVVAFVYLGRVDKRTQAARPRNKRDRHYTHTYIFPIYKHL